MNYNEKIANVLEEARNKSDDGIVNSKNLLPSARALLVKAGFLEKLVRGWYMLVSPESAGSSTSWFSVYWSFLRQYLADRFGKDGYCLSPQSSLDIFTGETVIPDQFIFITKKQSNVPLKLPFNTAILMYQDRNSFPEKFEQVYGINVMPIAYALVKAPLAYFQKKSMNVEIALSLIKPVSDISRELVKMGAVKAAERIAGAYEFFGYKNESLRIVQDMKIAGFMIKPANPIKRFEPFIGNLHFKSPYAARIHSNWESFREHVISCFPEPEHQEKHIEQEQIINDVKRFAQEDAYHSLSIEGYRITDELIERIRSGDWSPDNNKNDSPNRDALAARGYQLAYNIIIESIGKVMIGKNPGKVIRDDLHQWYRELFLPMAQAGLSRHEDLIGYRTGPVYINYARHVPPPANGVTDSMETFFNLIEKETNPAVRAVLGHYFFVYIHPYMDGNGRVARFLMNLMLVTSGYNWTIVRVTERNEYMRTLDLVATDQDIRPFTEFLAKEMKYWKLK